MALAAAARRSLASGSLSGPLARRLHPSLAQLLPSNSSGDPRKPSPLPPPPAPRPFHFALAPRGTSQTLSFPPFGLHLFPGPSRRSFSSSRDTGFTDTLTDAAHSAASAAVPASFPGEVAWAGLINGRRGGAASHRRDPFLHRWISIALSTVLLRCGMFTISTLVNKRLYGMRQDLEQYIKWVKNTKGEKSIQELADAADPMVRKLGFLPTLHIIVTPYTFITLYSAISNMVEKVPSLKGGGALWFPDLTTPDALCIFPMITSLFIMLRFEVNYGVAAKRTERSRKMEDNVRQVVRAMSLLPMLWTATLPQPEHPQNRKAISCSLVTWSGLTLAGKIGETCHRLLYLAIQFGLISITLDNTRLSLLAVLKHPDVQKFVSSNMMVEKKLGAEASFFLSTDGLVFEEQIYCVFVKKLP
ncbi:Mitochondrial inner membrane protein OXA1 [Triticum urartu]|uniref:Mitochondrial inner membrane protein OXA1 n=1 Tax=Triticum urartu TaxID=4572 RepID=M7ZK84_TRIUA|nr:Mitochondrial inner membrane protein OXA1 [Triticum urartu]